MPSESHLPTSRRHIPKWPFWLGDILLVGTGLALAFQQGGPLQPMAMAWVVISIAGGALIACAPYAIEHWANAVSGGAGGDWADLRNKLLKLEVRLAEIELNNGAVPESARLAQSRFADYANDEELGIGEVIKQPKAPVETPEPAKPAPFKFGPTGAALVGARATEESSDDSDLDLYDAEQPDEDLPTSLDDIGPAEKREPTHLRKALNQARNEHGSRAVARFIRGGKR
ncbi:hypothetical protein [Cerasicoccus arenae]|uniref:Uncharacterized protein n=1 Tax=Cerasicoccus arenae TaxID=424488 RepID=A0A8J3GBZ1_9BACT|nr:hypothetical protein [Cerasicoccus arenae]MBK1858312.1 hypothetical protein [Cerasicoccus arenae]GHB90699.1 hypothetical protein GCM10007047_01880 [Cerasicoccus arenae]